MQRDEGLRECLAQCKVIAFDVDGTLTDSIEQIITCFQRTFAYANLPVPSPEAIKGTIGMTLELGIRSLLPDPTDIKLGLRQVASGHQARLYRYPAAPRLLLDCLHRRHV